MYIFLIAIVLALRKAAASNNSEENDDSAKATEVAGRGVDAEQPDRRSDQVLKFTKFTDDI